MNKQLWMTALVAFGVTALTIGAYELLLDKDEKVVRIEHVDGTPAKGVMYAADEHGELVPLDFTGTAEKVVNSVVHIKSTITFRADEDPMARMPEFFDPFREFFGDPHGDSPFGPFFRFERPRGQQGPQVRVGTGSGVIISEDGYIVTNNHVVAEADDIEVTLHDNRTFKATVVGTDPSTDIAVIRIKADDLPALPFGDSDKVR
ncbi:MAG: serine protease, partial [Bacteroidetes bacterium]